MSPGLVRKLLENMESCIGLRHEFTGVLCMRHIAPPGGLIRAGSFHDLFRNRSCSSRIQIRCFTKLYAAGFQTLKVQLPPTKFSTWAALNSEDGVSSCSLSISSDGSAFSETATTEIVAEESTHSNSKGAKNGRTSEHPNQSPTVIAFDIETTGFRAADDRIIEFAARDLSGGDCSTMSALVNPGRPVPYIIAEITGITSEMVNQPHIPSWNEVALAIIRFVESRRKADEPVILVAHNGKRFDVPFLLKEFQSCSIEVPSWWLFLDSMPLAREARKRLGYDWPSLKLSDIFEAYGLETTEQAHRALADVNMLASVLGMIVGDLQLPVAKFIERSFNAEEIFASSKVFQGQDKEAGNDLLPDPDLVHAVAEAGKFEAPWEEEKDLDMRTNSIDTIERDMTLEEDCAEEMDMAVVSDEIISGVQLPLSKSFLDSSSVDATTLSPFLRQYVETKWKRPTFLHLVRAGSFYEAFFEDAATLSRSCKIRLNSIFDGEVEVPMSRVPKYKINLYTRLLLDKGLKVVKIDEDQEIACVLTPGMRLDDGICDDARNSFLVAVNLRSSGSWGLVHCDLMTGNFLATQSQGLPELIQELHRLDSKEAVLNSEALRIISPNMFCSIQPSSEFLPASRDTALHAYIGAGTSDLLRGWRLSDCAANALLTYIQQTQDVSLEELPLRKLSLYRMEDYLSMDTTVRNVLELVGTIMERQEGSLLWAMDETKTYMGSRMLRQWILRPLRNSEQISLRQSAVEVIMENRSVRAALRSLLSSVMDIERLVGHIGRISTITWDELLTLAESLLVVPKICLVLEKLPENSYFSAVMAPQAALTKLAEEIKDVFTCERRSDTPEKINEPEHKLLQVLRKQVIDSMLLLQETSDALAALDVLCSFAEVAAIRDYCKPELLPGRQITIVDGRHPMVEINEEFTPNSCYLGYQAESKRRELIWSRPDLLVLTGPKKSGKSCYMQQVALIQVLAQCGSFVPAKEAKLSVADGIYFIGRSDTGGVLEKATSSSLVLLDDFGPQAEFLSRAVVEYLANHIKARTLLAMQDNYLKLDGQFPNISNCHFSTSLDSKHTILPGIGSSSETPRVEGYPAWIQRRVEELEQKANEEKVRKSAAGATGGQDDGHGRSNLWNRIMEFTKANEPASPSQAPPKTPGNGATSSRDNSELKELWQQLSTVLRNSPATLALAQQKGSLLSISRTSQSAIVTIGSSPLFVRKFKQQEHAAALEAAFESLLNAPVRLEILVEE